MSFPIHSIRSFVRVADAIIVASKIYFIPLFSGNSYPGCAGAVDFFDFCGFRMIFHLKNIEFSDFLNNSFFKESRAETRDSSRESPLRILGFLRWFSEVVF